MKYISCFLLTMMFCINGFSTNAQPAQQYPKSKTDATDSKAAKNAIPKAQPVPTPQDSSKTKSKKDPTADDTELLTPLSWRPAFIY